MKGENKLTKKELDQLNDLKAEIQELEEKIAEEEQKKEEYNNQMEYYSTDEYIEKIVNMYRPAGIKYVIDYYDAETDPIKNQL